MRDNFTRLNEILNNGWAVERTLSKEYYASSKYHDGPWVADLDVCYEILGPYKSLEELMDNVELYECGSD